VRSEEGQEQEEAFFSWRVVNMEGASLPRSGGGLRRFRCLPPKDMFCHVLWRDLRSFFARQPPDLSPQQQKNLHLAPCRVTEVSMRRYLLALLVVIVAGGAVQSIKPPVLISLASPPAGFPVTNMGKLFRHF
jgi:hypothetical protein